MSKPSKRQRIFLVAAAVLAAGVALLLRPSFVSATDPEDKLHCASDKRVGTTVDHDESIVETKQPTELAAAWRDGTAGARTTALTEQTVFQESSTKTKIGYIDSKIA